MMMQFLERHQFQLQIDQVVDWTAKQLPSVSSLTSVFRITPEFTKRGCFNKTGSRAQGTLQPEIESYIQEYSLQVNSTGSENKYYLN